MTDLEKLDALHRYAMTGQMTDTSVRNVFIYNVLHKSERRFEVIKDKQFYKLSDQSILELNNELTDLFPNATIKMKKRENILSSQKMLFGKYKDKYLSDFISDTQYIKYLYEKIENLTQNYKFYFKNILKNIEMFDNNVVHLKDDSFEHIIQDTDICHTDASYNYYYNKEYGCIAKKRYGMNDGLCCVISGIKIEIHGVEFDLLTNKNN